MEKSFYKNIELSVPEGIYLPREDSILLASILEKELESKIRKKVLDVGCGSGFLAILAALSGFDVTAIDIDKVALEAAEKNAEKNGAEIKFLQSDLFSEMREKFDIIVFNPPYLPETITDFSRSWAGGEEMELLFEAIENVMKFLTSKGKLLMVISSLSGLDKILEKMREVGLESRIVAERKIPFETLYVIEAVRKVL